MAPKKKEENGLPITLSSGNGPDRQKLHRYTFTVTTIVANSCNDLQSVAQQAKDILEEGIAGCGMDDEYNYAADGDTVVKGFEVTLTKAEDIS